MTTKRLTASGHQVIGLARNPPDDSFPGIFHAVDLSDRANTLQTVTDKYAINGVVNNVGLVRPQAIEAVDLDDFTTVLDVNLRSTVQVTQAVLPTLQASGWGRFRDIIMVV